MSNEDKKLRLSREHRVIFGVCGGIADFFGIDPTLVRLVWVLAIIFGGFGILAYFICAIFLALCGSGD